MTADKKGRRGEARGPAKGETCARCGATFTCGMAAGQERCWCQDLPPAPPLPEASCLCPECLKKEISKRKKP